MSMELRKDEEGYYNQHCIDCNTSIRCKYKWRNMCTPCYKLNNHPNDYHRCSTCNKVCNIKYNNCFDCNKQQTINIIFVNE